MDEARRDDLSFLDAVVAGVFTVPGDGMVDFPAVLAELPGYDGWLVVEAEQDPGQSASFDLCPTGPRQSGRLRETRRLAMTVR